MEKSPALLSFMQGANVLIMDHSSSSRPVLRRLLSELGVAANNIKIAENYEEALKIIDFFKPKIVFTDYSMGEWTALDLQREFGRVVPNRAESVFIVIAAENRPMVATVVGEAEVDALLVRPLSIQDMHDKFIEAVLLKADPSPYHKLIEVGRDLLDAGKSDAALQAFVESRKLDNKPSKACYFEGLVHKRAGRLDTALKCFGQGLRYQANHYRCLAGVFDIYVEQKQYQKAYAAGIALARHYPIHPRRIPEMIRLCILNDKFLEVLQFAGAISELDEVDETLSKYVSAGLFICGKHLLLLGNKEEALRVFLKTESYSRIKPAVLREVIVTMLGGGLRAPAEEMLKRVPPEVGASAEVRVALLDLLHAEGPDGKAFVMSQELLHEGLKSSKLYEIAILQARGLQRPEHVVQDLLQRATAEFPELRGKFEEIARGLLRLAS